MEIAAFIEAFERSVKTNDFVKLTLSKPLHKSDALKNIYIRLITIKTEKRFSFTYRNISNDAVKNYPISEGITVLKEELNLFRAATLFTLTEDLSILFSKKRKTHLQRSNPTFKNKPPESHDLPRKRKTKDGAFMQSLGITDSNGRVIPKMADKYKQVHRYLEVIEGLIPQIDKSKTLHIVDFGSGKGYLTFALYDFLTHQKNMKVHVTGVELRPELVDFCNEVSQQIGYDNLTFKSGFIENVETPNIDMLIALHACDTATDDAILKGIVNNASLIVCAPCCHKQLRKQLKGVNHNNPMLKYGIFKERQLEMVTDTMRALLLERHAYNTKIFEFVANEHTRKNIMLVGQKTHKKPDQEMINEKLNQIKTQYQIDQYYLEEKLEQH